jgi:3-oxoacyl-[acyl-carrier protein] reductase
VQRLGLLEGKVAIITGSGRGIGSSAAQLFAAEGASVVVNDVDSSPAEATTEAIARAGGRAISVTGDVTEPAFPARLIGAALDAFGGIDILVNNAGFTWDGAIQNMTDRQWEAIIGVHLTAPFRILREASPFLLEAVRREQAEGGRATARKAINVSSVSAVYGQAGQANYAAAKAGLLGLTKALAREWGRYNVQVNALCYGFVETRLTGAKEHGEQVRCGSEEVALGMPEQARRLATLRIPLGRAGTPEEAAGPMLFLASPLSNYVSGIVLEVTGGDTL